MHNDLIKLRNLLVDPVNEAYKLMHAMRLQDDTVPHEKLIEYTTIRAKADTLCTIIDAIDKLK